MRREKRGELLEEAGRILMTVGVPDCTYIITYPTEQPAINFHGNVRVRGVRSGATLEE